MRMDRDEYECRGDLVTRERRGTLSASDQLALGAHLESCSSCRLTRDIRADFEAQSTVDLGDAARIARLSAAARRWSQRRTRPAARHRRLRSGLRGLALSLVGLLIAGTASATIWWWRAPVRPTLGELAADVIRPGPRPRPRAFLAHRWARAAAPPGTLPPATQPIEPALEPPREESSPVVAPHRLERRRPTPAATRQVAEPASSMLRRAGEARHDGDADQAIVIYRRLQQEFRDSPESTMSSVLLGGLLLQRGPAARALEQFDRYLTAQPRGNLIPEALYGRGRALAALGRGADERETWRRLLTRFPESAYASHARRRLDELK